MKYLVFNVNMDNRNVNCRRNLLAVNVTYRAIGCYQYYIGGGVAKSGAKTMDLEGFENLVTLHVKLIKQKALKINVFAMLRSL